MTGDALIAANRFGLGARPGELRAAASDPRGWLREQLHGTQELPDEIRALPSSAEALARYAQALQARREARELRDRDPPTQPQPQPQPQPLEDGARARLLSIYREQVAARYRVATRSRESFRERLIHFWTNHFAVSVDKPQVLALAGTLENEAIRPHLAGSFSDMLLAVEAHPAMILYLDNQASIGPHSPLAQRAARRGRKLDSNENLAREILELHTLGVTGGYTQADVTSFARALTGWSVGGLRGGASEAPGHFEFRDAAHEPGAKTILGKRYADAGIEQPRAVLRDFAGHPATAMHLATKLVRHFIADHPPPAAVERIATVFRDSNGALPSVHAALIDLPQAWTNERRKFKTPHEFVVSTYRALDFMPAATQQLVAQFNQLGQRPYAPGSPAGWADAANHWDGPDALLNRIEWSSALSQRMAQHISPLELATTACGDSLAAHTRGAIARAASAAQGLTLLLASPEFQRR